MPALSPTMSQGNVASWQVTEGTEITAGDILADIETDKATLPWENQDDGFIAKLLRPSGSKDIPVGTPLVVLVEEKDHISKFKDFKAEGSSAESDASAQKDQQTGNQSSKTCHTLTTTWLHLVFNVNLIFSYAKLALLHAYSMKLYTILR